MHDCVKSRTKKMTTFIKYNHTLLEVVVVIFYFWFKKHSLICSFPSVWLICHKIRWDLTVIFPHMPEDLAWISWQKWWRNLLSVLSHSADCVRWGGGGGSDVMIYRYLSFPDDAVRALSVFFVLLGLVVTLLVAEQPQGLRALQLDLELLQGRRPENKTNLKKNWK